MSAFPARYVSACAGCDARIHEDDLIVVTADGAMHEDCAAAEDHHPGPPAVTHPVCPVCWLTHPEGACDR